MRRPLSNTSAHLASNCLKYAATVPLVGAPCLDDSYMYIKVSHSTYMYYCLASLLSTVSHPHCYYLVGIVYLACLPRILCTVLSASHVLVVASSHVTTASRQNPPTGS